MTCVTTPSQDAKPGLYSGRISCTSLRQEALNTQVKGLLSRAPLCNMPRTSAKLAGITGIFIALLLGSNLVPAKAGTEVLGELDALQFRAENASTREVLEALAASFKLSYKLPPNIDRIWNGVYSGSLRRVLARILNDTNYIIKSSDRGIEVIVLSGYGASGPTGVAVSSDANPTAENAVVALPRPAAPQPAPVPTLTTSQSPPPLASYLPNN